MNETKETMVCPVCNEKRNGDSGYACGKCKFEFAYISFFANKESKALWDKKVENYKKEHEPQNTEVSGDDIIVCRDSVGFFSAGRKEMTVIFGDGRRKIRINNIAQFVSNNNNSVYLFADGSVSVVGDNTYGQHNIGRITEICRVALSSTCVFMVKKDGSVVFNGFLDYEIKDELSTWNDIVELSVSDEMVLGLTNKGNVRVAETCLKSDELSKIYSWRNVKKVCVFEDDCLALLDDGVIKIAKCNDESVLESETWTGIKDIIYDGTYVIGLTESKEVKMTGKSRNKLFDAGRSAASNWTDIEAIAYSNYAIGGYDTNGNLHLAGKFGGKTEALIEEWNREIRDSYWS